MAKITPVSPEPGKLVWFHRNGKEYVSGPFKFLGDGKYIDIHTKAPVNPIGTPCLIEAECKVYGSDMEIVKKLQKKIVEEIKQSE